MSVRLRSVNMLEASVNKLLAMLVPEIEHAVFPPRCETASRTPHRHGRRGWASTAADSLQDRILDQHPARARCRRLRRLKPVRKAAPLPRLMPCSNGAISGCLAASDFITSTERSEEPSSTMTISSAKPTAIGGQHPFHNGFQRAFLVEARNHDRQLAHTHGGITATEEMTGLRARPRPSLLK